MWHKISVLALLICVLCTAHSNPILARLRERSLSPLSDLDIAQLQEQASIDDPESFLETTQAPLAGAPDIPRPAAPLSPAAVAPASNSDVVRPGPIPGLVRPNVLPPAAPFENNILVRRQASTGLAISTEGNTLNTAINAKEATTGAYVKPETVLALNTWGSSGDSSSSSSTGVDSSSSSTAYEQPDWKPELSSSSSTGDSSSSSGQTGPRFIRPLVIPHKDPNQWIHILPTPPPPAIPEDLPALPAAQIAKIPLEDQPKFVNRGYPVRPDIREPVDSSTALPALPLPLPLPPSSSTGVIITKVPAGYITQQYPAAFGNADPTVAVQAVAAAAAAAAANGAASASASASAHALLEQTETKPYNNKVTNTISLENDDAFVEAEDKEDSTSNKDSASSEDAVDSLIEYKTEKQQSTDGSDDF